MKKFLIILLSLVLCTLSLSCGNEAKNIDTPKPKRVYVVGLDDEYAPMGFRDDKGEIVGFDIDLAKEAARRMGVEFEFHPIVWDKKEAELNSGRIDIIWNGLDITPERQGYVLYSKPYLDNRQLLLVKKSRGFNIQSVNDLAGKIVATQSGSNSEGYVERDSALRSSLADFITYPSFNQAFKDLHDDKIDVLIVDEIAGRYEMSKHPDELAIIEIQIGTATELGIGFRLGDVELRDEVQKVFDEMIADGTAQKISEKWFKADLVIRD